MSGYGSAVYSKVPTLTALDVSTVPGGTETDFRTVLDRQRSRFRLCHCSPSTYQGDQACVLFRLSWLRTRRLTPGSTEDGMRQEDEAFRQYLADNGYDVSQMSAPEEVDDESIDEDKKEEMYWKLSDLIICLRRGDQVDEISGFS